MAVVRIDFEVNQNGEVSIRKTTAAARELADQTKGTKSVLDSLFAGIGQGVGQKIFGEVQAAVKAAAVAVIDATVQLAKFGSHLADLSAKSGASTQSLQKLGFAGSLVGVSLDEISAALPKMQRNLVDGNKAFGLLGLSVDQLRKMEPDRQFAEIAEAIGRIRDPASQSAAAMEIFGKSGASLLPLMKSDIAAVSDEAVRLGIVLDADTVAAADKLDDALTTLDQTWNGFKNQLASVIVQNPEVVRSITLITEAIGGLSRIIQDNKPWIAEFISNYAKLTDLLVFSNGLQGYLGAAKKGAEILGAMGQKSTVGGQRPWLNTVSAGNVLTFDPSKAKAASKAADDFERGRAKANNDATAQAIKDEQAIFDFKNRTALLAARLDKDEEERASRLGKIILTKLKDEAAAQAEFDKEWQQAQEEEIVKTQKQIDSLLQLGGAMQNLGAVAGGTFGAMVSLGGGVVNMLAGIKQNAQGTLSTIDKFAIGIAAVANIIQNGPAGKGKGAMSGALAGAGAGAQIGGWWGAAIGGIVGGIVGFFSGGSKQRKLDQEKARQEAEQKATERAARIATGTGRMETGIVAGIAGLGTPTQAAATAQATLLAGVFWTVFKEKGLLGAVDAFKETFAQLTASGFDVGSILGPIANVMSAGMNEAFRAATEGAQGFRDMLHGMTEAEIPVTVAQMAALGEEANRAMEMARAGAVEAGLSATDANLAALAAVSPLLQELLVASERYGITLDENTQSLIDQARAAGLAFPTGPLDKMVSLLEQMVLLLGGELPAAAARAGTAIGGIVNAGPMRGSVEMPDSPDTIGAARGYGPIVVPNLGRGLGPRIQTHAGEGVLIVPRAHVGRMPTVFGAARGFGFSRDTGDFEFGGRGTGSGGGIGTGASTTSMGDVTFTTGGGGRARVEATQEAIQSLTEEIGALKAAVQQAATAQPISVVTNSPISVEQNPLRVRESAMEAEEFATNAIVRQLQRKNADLVAEIRAVMREGR